ncbi:hypothetical protein [Comamonas sp.]|uniref:hypothetical protein n=1 Tax=Comamonas sp. TaxID=34028 RepID=UPI003A91C59A
MDLSQKTDSEIMSIANPIMDNLMDASTAIDYERHIKDFTDRLKSVLSRERLKWICQDYQDTKGFFAKREFVATFRRPESVAIVWKQTFTKQPGDFVAEMVLVQQDGKYLVDHVMVF